MIFLNVSINIIVECMMHTLKGVCSANLADLTQIEQLKCICCRQSFTFIFFSQQGIKETFQSRHDLVFIRQNSYIAVLDVSNSLVLFSFSLVLDSLHIYFSVLISNRACHKCIDP